VGRPPLPYAHLAAGREKSAQPEPGVYPWSAEHDGHCVGSARLMVDAGQHRAEYSVGLFVPTLRGRGLGREITRLVPRFTVTGASRPTSR